VTSHDPRTSDPESTSGSSVVAHFANLAMHVHSSEDYDDSLRRITHTAIDSISGCEAASLSLLEKEGPVTRAATSELATLGDQIQYEEMEGPCLDAAMEDRLVHAPNLGVDQRWPKSSGRLSSELGVASMLSCRLALDVAPRHTLGGLNMYATKLDAFTEDDKMLALLLSSLGAVVIDASRQQVHLRAAIESRQTIGEAIGILRAQQGVSSQEAFDMLSKASQRMNIKLRDLAQRISDSGGGTPPPKI
jgi:transcriptional regulator with GAF, ATPase, and Fis domain